MKTLFSTNDVHPRDRFDYWHQVACRKIVQHDARPACRATFEAAMHTGVLADLELVVFENGAMDIERTPRQIAHATNDNLFVCQQISGVLGLEQIGRQIVLETGDVTLLDPLLPYVEKFYSTSKTLVLKVPRRALEARVGKTQRSVARFLELARPEGSLISSFLAMLPAHICRMQPAAQAIMKNCILDLLGVSLTNVVQKDALISTAHLVAVMNLRVAIEAHLRNPALKSGTVAGAAGISVRYANKVLAREGTSIMRLIQSRRLERCRRALEDPSQSHRTLTEIALGWGFSDMTHFGRVFKAAYGAAPSEYRHQRGRIGIRASSFPSLSFTDTA
jgi:AraC family transcriptional regulator, positive regulator of tynA and feaB